MEKVNNFYKFIDFSIKVVKLSIEAIQRVVYKIRLIPLIWEIKKEKLKEGLQIIDKYIFIPYPEKEPVLRPDKKINHLVLEYKITTTDQDLEFSTDLEIIFLKYVLFTTKHYFTKLENNKHNIRISIKMGIDTFLSTPSFLWNGSIANPVIPLEEALAFEELREALNTLLDRYEESDITYISFDISHFEVTEESIKEWSSIYDTINFEEYTIKI